mmetsp:Transcript_17357/g.45303  ORF Transcript_17357/g.45303 Transcript_17357/m.45303 type:complete len:500 (+) Transcript_17357:115-1614(+)|eukprot:CAMPEP_0182926410 /NCGR_PEP_ID=MMETSP0105_2-20130417/12023_1 /TAXON_ID=81532 ORGANISM="Acanthoeca-like sp., Strain 10tr" /NCGR_SAMPLE_ID=MMETSP0105_2 /ASSEMBLY_ACC=CAM_ASM_000205 /LENGTH=499 /DNA_ID=CAMNT_0025064305 /DNA_START=111 /DNA_END=1610 /DNA_ORIENTATION=+
MKRGDKGTPGLARFLRFLPLSVRRFVLKQGWLMGTNEPTGSAALRRSCFSYCCGCCGFFILIILWLVNLSQQPGAQDPKATTIGARVYQFYRGGNMPKWLMIGINEFGQSRRYTGFLQLKGGRAVNRAKQEAEAYYESQFPLFMDAAASWELTEPMATVAKFAPRPSSATWYGMITARARAYAYNKKQHPDWDDYRIEKDKCDMYEFMNANGLPCGSWAGIWRADKGYPQASSAISAALVAVSRNQTTANNLLVVKMCHISMGHYDSSWVVPNLDALGLDTTMERIRGLYTLKPTDRTRSWGPIFDPLTQSIPAGLMVQYPFSGKLEPAELKIEVIWGRAYLALIDTSGYAFGKCTSEGAMILRDDSIIAYNSAWASKAEPCSDWIVKEGHMKYAWSLAEGFAKAAKIDAVRVDVFLWPGHPERAVINEISLSSGAMYKWHFHLMAQIWAEGHKRQQYKVTYPGVAMQKIANGKDWYSKTFVKCNRDILHPEAYAKYCV